MSFLTDLSHDDCIELRVKESAIFIKVIKRSGFKVRISIDAGRKVSIKKIDGIKNDLGNED